MLVRKLHCPDDVVSVHHPQGGISTFDLPPGLHQYYLKVTSEIESVCSRAGALHTETTKLGFLEIVHDWDLLEQSIGLFEYDLLLGMGIGAEELVEVSET